LKAVIAVHLIIAILESIAVTVMDEVFMVSSLSVAVPLETSHL
jgi:hypothetical protein